MSIQAVSRAPFVIHSFPEKKLCCLRLLCKKVREIWTAFWGFFARVFVFHHAAAHTFASRFLLGTLKGRCYQTVKDGGIDQKRTNKLLEGMINLGGKTAVIKTNEPGVEVEYVVLSFSEFKSRIEKAGGQLIQGEEMVIVPPKDVEQRKGRKWQEFAGALRSFCNDKNPNKIGWKQREDGSFFLGKNSKMEKGTCILRCRGPAGVYESKTFISGYLGAGIDICLFNWPGTLKSKGRASESAHYAAADAVYQTLCKEFHYDPRKMYASGFCLGGAVAANLYKEHAKEGLHLIMEHTFSSMHKMMSGLAKFECLATTAVGTLQSPEGKGQDGFNVKAKLANVPANTSGSIMVVSTENDITVPPDSHSTLVAAGKRCSKKVGEIYWKNPYLKGHQTHGDDPLQYKALWDRHLEWLKQTA